jgi:hypothetical protein
VPADRPSHTLLFAPRPFSDELLLSWISRVAAANHCEINILFPELAHLSPYRLNCNPGESILHGLALATRLHYSTLLNLLLPSQFTAFAQLSFLKLAEVSEPRIDDDEEVSFHPPFCQACAGDAEHALRDLYWKAETGLPTTTLCLQHHSFAMRICPECADTRLALRWEQNHSVVRCSRCCWRPAPLAKHNIASADPAGPWDLLCHLQRDIATALRGRTPSYFWFGEISPAQFLDLLNDLYWLLRTPGLSVLADPLCSFCDSFFWTSPLSSARLLFHRTGHSSFPTWHPDSRAELLLALTATMLGPRACATLKHQTFYPPVSDCYPFCWILRCMKTSHAHQLRDMASSWPPSSGRVWTLPGRPTRERFVATRSIPIPMAEARLFSELNGHILIVKWTPWRYSPR